MTWGLHPSTPALRVRMLPDISMSHQKRLKVATQAYPGGYLRKAVKCTSTQFE